ncbi:MAG TPA: porin [Noviherbaspirillum sp.]
MKKSLLALAVLGAFAGAASAQTNVTIYGIVDAAIERFDTNTTSATWSLTDGNSSFNKNGSRLGFRGTEDLGGGLSAIFTLENGFNVDTGAMRADGIFSRQAFVGLQGGFGAVKFGRQYTPMFLALDAIDPFGTGMAGAINRLFNANGVRSSNTVNYSMAAAGLTGQLAYSFGEVAGDNSASRQIGLGLGYANGPINVQFAYHDANNATNTGDTQTALIGGSYNLGVAKIHAGFQTDKTETGAVTNVKDRNWMLGASAPVGAGEVRASFIRSDDRLANADTDQYALGYVHNLSKRTNVYTSYARQNDKSATNADNNVFNVGLQHRF